MQSMKRTFGMRVRLGKDDMTLMTRKRSRRRELMMTMMFDDVEYDSDD